MVGVEQLATKENAELLSLAYWTALILLGGYVYVDIAKKLFDSFGSAVLLKMNQRLNENRTFFTMQRLGGQPFTAKLLKITWTKVYFVCDDEELLELTTSEFRQSSKKYKKSQPKDAGVWADVAPGDFGL